MSDAYLGPDWRLYERFVASLYSSCASDDVTVIPNAKLVGAITGRKRQIDLLVDSRLEHDESRRVIFDAKQHKRKVDVKDVEAFEGMMRDCRAQRGVIVCPHGFTEAARRRAQKHIGLRLLSLEDLQGFDVGAWERCRGACSYAASKRRRKGWVLYDQPFGLTIGDSPLSIVVVGKCDECLNFHVWCWNCGSKFALGDEAEHHCGCDWYWFTAIEQESDESERDLEAVLLLLVKPPVIFTVDRRPLA